MELFATVMRDFEMTSYEWWKKKTEDPTDRFGRITPKKIRPFDVSARKKKG